MKKALYGLLGFILLAVGIVSLWPTTNLMVAGFGTEPIGMLLGEALFPLCIFAGAYWLLKKGRKDSK